MRRFAALVGTILAPFLATVGCATDADHAPPAASARTAPPAPKPLPPVSPETLARLEADLVRIPAGSLPSRWEKHVKLAPVPVGSFWMARHEVTRRDWAEVMGEGPGPDAESAMLPVANITWREAHRFLDRLNEAKGGPVFRLPTASEWELGCRAGAQGRVPIQANEKTLGQYAWWGKNSREEPHPVGRLKPNAYGLYDILGNVAEWCETALDPDATDRLRANPGGNFVDANLVGQDCNPRAFLAEDGREAFTGFRLASSVGK